MAALCDNLCIAWSGDYDSLKKFISEDLKLDGNWEQPGSDKKVFKTDNFSVSWRKSKSLLHFEGDETRNIAQVLCAVIVKNFDPAVNKDTNTSNSNSSCKTKSTSLLPLSGASCKCTDIHSDIQVKLSQSVNREAIQALSDSVACITEAITQFQEDIDKSRSNKKAKNISNFMQEPIGKQNIHVVNDANDSNAPDNSYGPDIGVNEVPPHENTIHTALSKNPSTYNAPVPKHLVPCPFLRKKGHCLKGYKCDFSHNINSRHLQSNYQGVQRPPFYKQTSHPYHIYPPLINYPVFHPYNNYPFMQPLMDIPTKWPGRR